ncbi:hypothetical protein [Allorhodopirellula solitaria]|nr:hypothetical protein [Allorhodopirellula solitaria]
MSKYVSVARSNKQIELNLGIAAQLAFAAAIYPRQSKWEKNSSKNVLAIRLDLINDFHLTGRNKEEMVRCLMPITRTGKNKLFTVPKSYPCQYDLDEKMRPMKRASDHIPRQRAGS